MDGMRHVACRPFFWVDIVGLYSEQDKFDKHMFMWQLSK